MECGDSSPLLNSRLVGVELVFLESYADKSALKSANKFAHSKNPV